MSWYYQGTLIETLPEECIGFVYCITNNITGRKYIGKKLAKFSKTTYKTVKLKNGKKKRKKIRGTIDSDWQTYYGSSPELSRDVELLGTENFTREILYYCRSRAECPLRTATRREKKTSSERARENPKKGSWSNSQFKV